MGMAFFASAAETPTSKPIGKVIGNEIKGNSTGLILEVNKGLVPGRVVKLEDGLTAVVGQLLSERMGLYYYEATLSGKYKIAAGLSVYPEGTALVPMKTAPGPTFWKKLADTWSPYTAKKTAEVTSVQSNRALIDRGSMHEVHERDIYAIYDSSGHYKGMLEVRGPGDFQSQGKLYNALEDRGKRRNALNTAAGDKAQFLGQRKLFNLHGAYGFRNKRENVLGEPEKVTSGGLLWSVTAPDGWGFEILFGAFTRKVVSEEKIRTQDSSPGELSYQDLKIKHKATFMAPMWLRKNFFYPHAFSPYIGLGTAYLNVEYSYYRQSNFNATPPDWQVRVETTKTKREAGRFIPMFGGGIELFPGRFLHPRAEVRYFHGPEFFTETDIFNTSSIYYSFALSTSW
ncbi:MAG: hypothetical protein HY401_09785 [Elusimicrobia bacterium]|nr:hypothetical protein [Elusimicrobiota bacterium]